jgi:hypothetical protein
MPFQPADATSLAAFVVIVIAVLAAFVAGVHRAHRGMPGGGGQTLKIAFAAAVWVGLLGWIVASRRMQQLPLNGLPFFFGSILVVSVAVALSPLGSRLATGVQIAALVGFQAFRLPLELVLHSWAAQGTIPGTMTWTGQNWDIVSGIVCLAAMPWANRNRAVAWTANIIGSLLLLNVIRVALLSSPLPIGWGTQPPLLLALYFPYALIGPVCVGGALIGHIVLTRALLRRSVP